MTAGDPGPKPGQDRATAELRRLLMQVLEDDRARTEALSALLACRVLAGTWPTSAEAVRTLTNSDGEQAMPLFSGREELYSAARRFGWMNSDGSVSLRELDAREALASALAHGVHFVVIDICAEHALELGREELADALQSPPQVAPRKAAPTPARSQAPPPAAAVLGPAVKLAQVPALVSKRAPLLLGEIDMPFAPERRPSRVTGGAVEEVVAARPRGTPRRDPRVEPLSSPAPAPARARRKSSRSTPGVGQRTGAQQAPAQQAPARQATERQATDRQATAQQAPAQRVPAQQAPAQQPARQAPARQAPATHEELPYPPPPPQAPAPAFEFARDEPRAAVPQAPPELSSAALPPLIGALPPLDSLLAAFPDVEQGSFAAGFGHGSDQEPEARPAALEAAVMVSQIAKMGGDKATQDAAAEVAEMLKDLATRGGVEENKPSPAQSAAKTLAGMLTAELEADHKRTKRGVRAKTEDKPEPVAEAAPAQQSSSEGPSLQPPQAPLDDAVLDEIAEGLRRYPEVEWACEACDGAGATVIGVRIAPTFLTNAEEIKITIVRIAASHKARVSVLLLSDTQQMRDARAQGIAFYPWRKRAAKR